MRTSLRLVVLAGLLGFASPARAEAQSATTPPPPDTTITIQASSSTLEFDPPAIAVRQGTRVRLRFSNTGTLPHNIVLVRRESDIDSLAAAASKTGGNFVPTDAGDKLIAYTTLASPGETVEVTFLVPPPGVYTYVCMVSGHSVSMLGTLRSLR